MERNSLGFAIGWRRFRVSAAAQWALRWDAAEMRMRYSHGDVVTRLPPGAANLGCSAHCGVEGMLIGRHILTFQARPPCAAPSPRSASLSRPPPSRERPAYAAFARAGATVRNAGGGGGGRVSGCTQGHPEFSAAEGSACLLDIARARALPLDPAGLADPDPHDPEILVKSPPRSPPPPDHTVRAVATRGARRRAYTPAMFPPGRWPGPAVPSANGGAWGRGRGDVRGGRGGGRQGRRGGFLGEGLSRPAAGLAGRQ